MEKTIREFTKYEKARIIGARALQISMDAPVLLKLTQEQLGELNYDSLKIAQKELEDGVLPISINRPLPERKESKLKTVKKESVNPEQDSTETSLDNEDEIVQELEQSFEPEEEEDSSDSESE